MVNISSSSSSSVNGLNDITNAVIRSTINYGSELPLAQGINFG